jgi:hypothetical protein
MVACHLKYLFKTHWYRGPQPRFRVVYRSFALTTRQTVVTRPKSQDLGLGLSQEELAVLEPPRRVRLEWSKKDNRFHYDFLPHPTSIFVVEEAYRPRIDHFTQQWTAQEEDKLWESWTTEDEECLQLTGILFSLVFTPIIRS